MSLSAPLISEYQVVLPYMSAAELNIGILFTLCTVSILETGGGEGFEYVNMEPFVSESGRHGEFYYKILHLASKAPSYVRMLAPKGVFEIHAKTENEYPTIKTEYTNPEYMKNNFLLTMLTVVEDDDKAGRDDVFKEFLGPEKFQKRKIIPIDIVNDPVMSDDYSPLTDPTLVFVKSANNGAGGILTSNWKETEPKFLTVYMSVEIEFKWWGLQTRVQNLIQKATIRATRNFYRTLICTMDEWHGMSIEEIREYEEWTKGVLENMRATGDVRGTKEQ